MAQLTQTREELRSWRQRSEDLAAELEQVRQNGAWLRDRLSASDAANGQLKAEAERWRHAEKAAAANGPRCKPLLAAPHKTIIATLPCLTDRLCQVGRGRAARGRPCLQCVFYSILFSSVRDHLLRALWPRACASGWRSWRSRARKKNGQLAEWQIRAGSGHQVSEGPDGLGGVRKRCRLLASLGPICLDLGIRSSCSCRRPVAAWLCRRPSVRSCARSWLQLSPRPSCTCGPQLSPN